MANIFVCSSAPSDTLGSSPNIPPRSSSTSLLRAGEDHIAYKNSTNSLFSSSFCPVDFATSQPCTAKSITRSSIYERAGVSPYERCTTISSDVNCSNASCAAVNDSLYASKGLSPNKSPSKRLPTSCTVFPTRISGTHTFSYTIWFTKSRTDQGAQLETSFHWFSPMPAINLSVPSPAFLCNSIKLSISSIFPIPLLTFQHS